jgi:hypothetical protein
MAFFLKNESSLSPNLFNKLKSNKPKDLLAKQSAVLALHQRTWFSLVFVELVRHETCVALRLFVLLQLSFLLQPFYVRLLVCGFLRGVFPRLGACFARRRVRFLQFVVDYYCFMGI